MKERKLPRLAYNWISMIGAFAAVVAVLVMTFLYVIDLFAKETNPYFGIFLYMIMPAILIFGLFLIPVGIFCQWRKSKKVEKLETARWPNVDLNDKRQRNAAAVFFFGTILFLGLTSVGSYQAYHYSESVTFCGRLCHTVMKPEYTAYQNSPHARVACVACHVGPGADWFAKSKLSGAYQVYATAFNIYPRPIETPIENLRPARETCEQCHWPDKFFGGQQRLFNHYMYDEDNTHWPINMLIKVGGPNLRSGEAVDIHWHVSPDIKVEYIARDKQRQNIPWVKVTNLKTGKETIYQNEDEPLNEEEIASAEPRNMDCVDCHNRPSHIYNSPDHVINMAMAAGQINITLPEIKRIAVEAMAEEYETESEALSKIAGTITEFYREEYPELHDSRLMDIEQAVKAVQAELSNNIFPEMKVRWEEYPDNIGHLEWPGCMRCHEGYHTDNNGKAVTHECSSCHTIIAQGSGERKMVSLSGEGLEFEHPEDIDEAWREMGCYECHTGTQP